MAGQAKYCTIEDVAAATDVKASAYVDPQLWRAIEGASRAIDKLTHRTWWPQYATRYFNWPNYQRAQSGVLWLDQDELLSVATLVSGGTTIPSTDFYLEPANGGPPYDRIELDTSASSTFTSGSTDQRAIEITGTFGACNDTEDATTVDGAVTDRQKTLTVAESAAVGVGDSVLVDAEWMLVTGKTMADTGVTGSSLASSNASVSLTCSTTVGIPQVGETVLIDSERLLVVDSAGLTLTVKRAQGGSVLAAHADASPLYCPRVLAVTRAAFGTTAVAHADASTVYRLDVPGPIRDLAIAETIVRYEYESSGYGRKISADESEREVSASAIGDIRRQVRKYFARRARTRSI